MTTRDGSRELRQLDESNLEEATGGLHPALFVGGLLLMGGLALLGVHREKQSCRAQGKVPDVRSFGGGVHVRCNDP